MNKILKFSVLCLIMLQSHIVCGAYRSKYSHGIPRPTYSPEEIEKLWTMRFEICDRNFIFFLEDKQTSWTGTFTDNTEMAVEKKIDFNYNWLNFTYIFSSNNVEKHRLGYCIGKNCCLSTTSRSTRYSTKRYYSEADLNKELTWTRSIMSDKDERNLHTFLNNLKVKTPQQYLSSFYFKQKDRDQFEMSRQNLLNFLHTRAHDNSKGG